MSSETDSDYETYKRTSLTRSVEYDRLYKGGDNTLSSTPFATESESLYKNEYDEYGGHYAQYQNHSKCGRQIDFENEYAEYECGRSETGSEKAQKAKKQLCMRCWISFLILFLLGSVIFGILAVFDKTDIFKNSIDNSISFEFTKDSNFTEPFSSTTTKTITSTTVRTTEPTEKPFPNAIELAGTTTENYWKDYQLLGLYNIHGTKNGAPSYKRARNAFILGEIYFWFVSRCGEKQWVVTSKQDFGKDCPGRWLWKSSEETDPSKIGQGQSEEQRRTWGEAEQFGGKMHTANITVKAFYN